MAFAFKDETVHLPHLSTKNAIPEYKVQDLKASFCILLHYSILKIVWDWLIVLCTFYFAIMVPYNAAFYRDSNERTLRTLDMVIEVLFIIGVLGASDETGATIATGETISENRALFSIQRSRFGDPDVYILPPGALVRLRVVRSWEPGTQKFADEEPQ
ncbi:hypothetical protein Aperf_G00000041807 [Anoplocephala perfoliata]